MDREGQSQEVTLKQNTGVKGGEATWPLGEEGSTHGEKSGGWASLKAGLAEPQGMLGRLLCFFFFSFQCS